MTMPRATTPTNKDAKRLSQEARALAYVQEVCVPPEKVAVATSSVLEVLAAAEDHQLDLFPFPGPSASVKKLSTAAAQALQREQAAAALTDPTNPAKIRAALGKNPRISSIIPALVRDPTKGWDARGATVRTPRDMAALLLALRSPYIETFKVAVLNNDSQIVHSEIVSIGSTTAALADPGMLARALQRLPRRSGALRVCVAHNHPSGVPDPSAPDVQITRAFSDVCNQLGYELVDHVITNGSKYFSFAEAGMIATGRLTARVASRAKPAAVGEDATPMEFGFKAPWEVVRREDLAIMNRSDLADPMFQALKQVDPTAAYIAYLTRKNTLLGLERVSGFDAKADILALKRTIFEGLGREGGTAMLVSLPDMLAPAKAVQLVRDLRTFAKTANAELLDLFHLSIGGEYHSARNAGLLEARAPYIARNMRRRKNRSRETASALLSHGNSAARDRRGLER